MNYSSPGHAKPLYCLLAMFLVLASLPAFAAPQTTSGISLRFVTDGNILPRRGHETLTVESVDIDRLEASILHVPEGDTLAILQHPDAAIPPEASEIWHAQLPAGATAETLGLPVKTTLDVLQTIKQLQPGLYIAQMHEVTSGKPRVEARKIFMITNIGLEVLGGADGIAVQARLLSEANPAQNIEIALIARNNREIARARADAEGIVRFDRDQISGKGEDAPAALYAYGADGEFTALALTPHEPATTPPAQAWIVMDKTSYKPGEEIKGAVLVRQTDGDAAKRPPVYAQLVNAAGEVAELQNSVENTGRLDLHAPAAALGRSWTIGLYTDQAGKPVLLGSAPVTISESGADSDASNSPSSASAQRPAGGIILSPGRRSFQPGETANISVQPADEADVTIALVDTSVHTVIRQHIGKDGAVVQLPIPGDARGGMYVLATAFTAPTNAGKPIQRSYGAQWIDIDEGTRRMGVRLDTPEKVDAGGKLPVNITLPDLSGKQGMVMLIGTDAAQPVTLDPFVFFFGQRPLAVSVDDSYAGIIGASQTPPLLPIFVPPRTVLAPALIWQYPTPADKSGSAKFNEIMPALSEKNAVLRLSAIAWSDDKIGYAEASIDETRNGRATKATPSKKPAQMQAATLHATTLKPGTSLTLKPSQSATVAVDPIVAALPAPNESAVAYMDESREFTTSLIGSLDDETILRGAIVGAAMKAQGMRLPYSTEAKLLDGVQALADTSGLDPDNAYLAHLVLLHSGRENALEVRHWLASVAKPETMLALASRLAMSDAAPVTDAQRDEMLAAIDKDDSDDLDTQALVLCILAQANQPWPPRLAHSVSENGLKKPSVTARTDLALHLAQAAHSTWGQPKVEIGGKPVTIKNQDTRSLFAWIATGLPQ